MKAVTLITIAAFAASPANAAIRAVSLDFCADQYLLAVAAPGQILAVSPGADGNDSYMRARAKDVRVARPTVEAIAALKPDVVFRFWGGGPQMSATLKRFGARVVTLDYPDSFATVKKDIRTVARALDREAQGDAMIADLGRRLAALKERPPSKLSALYVTPGGVTAGRGTMIDAVFKAAGLQNPAAGEQGWPALPLEKLALKPPQLIVAGFFGATTEYVNHWSASRHPVFAEIFKETPNVKLKADIISCPAWYSVEAAEAIAARVETLEKDRPYAE